MDDQSKAIFTSSLMRKKFLIVYLKGCLVPVVIPVADTEATYRKIKKHLSKGDSGKLLKDVLEKKLLTGKNEKYIIPLNQVIAVGIQDLSDDETLSYL